METVHGFLNRLAGNGVKLSLDAGQLSCYAPKGALTPELREGIVRFKPEILALLEVRSAQPQAQGPREFPLSAGQKGLYIVDRLQPGTTAYNVPVCLKLTSSIDGDLMARAWEYVLQQYPILTARVIDRDGALYHRLDEACRTTLQQQAIAFSSDEELLSFLRQKAKAPFDLNAGPLTRIDLFTRKGESSILLLTVHHIVFDGASAMIVLRSLLEIYQQLSEGKPVRLSQELLGYEEFVAWEEAMLASPEGAVHASYWQQQLDGELPSIEIFPDAPRQASPTFEASSLVETLPADLAQWVRQFSRAHSMPPSVLFLGLFQLLLHRYTGQDDIIVGMPVMGRAAQKFAAEVGYFVNMVPLRTNCDPNLKLTDLLRKVQGTMLDALYHSSYPFPLMLESLRTRGAEANPVFQISYAYQNFIRPTDFMSLNLRALEPANIAEVVQEGYSDLALEIYEDHQTSSFTVFLKYNADLYTRATMAALFERYCVLLRGASENPDRLLHEYSLLTDSEQQKVLVDFNDTRAEFPEDQCLHQLVAEQAALHPEKIAVICGDEQLTYQQLFAKSRDLALYLQSQGAGPDVLVGVCMERSPEMLAGVLGVLQAGGAYVALDPEYPDDRLAYMIEDSRVAVVLTQEKLRERLTALCGSGVDAVALDAQWPAIEERVAGLKSRNVQLEDRATPRNLAYVIYTSGSTGRPKGVMVEHRSVINYLTYCARNYVTPGDNVSASFIHFPLTFDASVTSLFAPLVVGKAVEINQNDALETFKEGAFLNGGYDFVKLTPAHMLLLRSNVANVSAESFRKKNLFVVGGEALTRDHVEFLHRAGANIEIVNEYGPTEATVGCTTSRFSVADCDDITIGTPIANTRIYVLDAHGNPQPVGIPGELHIAGDGLARGYLHRPELTEEKFVANPFVPGTRMYKSGDLARWRNDGTLEYLGRVDTQVKIRGFRIELGEIEAQLNQHPRVQDSAVIAQGQGANRQLIAFYCAKETTADRLVELPSEELRAHLLRTLPDYMAPVAFVAVTAIPLNPNGKVDRRVLERMNVSVASAREYVAPRTETETQLTAVWADVLNLEPGRIGVNDNFFELGGHSLLATQLISRIRAQFGVDLPLKAIFERTNVADLAAFLSGSEQSDVPAIVPVDRTQYDRLPLSFAQERLWFINQLDPESAGYNVPGAVVLSGELDVDQLEQAFNVIIARHENLRTCFPSEDGQAYQRILDRVDFRVERIDLSAAGTRDAADELCRADAARPFDLANGPLLRCKAIRISEREHILMLNMHHIISDGWSLGVLIRELGIVMSELRQGRRPELAPLPIQYADYAIWQRNRLEEEGILERQLAYWQGKLAGVPESLDLPTDHPRPAVRSYAGTRQSFALDAELTAKLDRLAEQNGGTLYMVLLAAFKALLHRYTGHNDICVGSAIANRQYGETEGLIGMFVNTLALRSQVEGEESFAALLARVKTTCLEAYEHQDVPFDKVVDAVRPQRNTAITPLFQVMLILQNVAMGTLDAQIETYPLDSGVTKFDMTVELTQGPDGLAGSIEYSTALYTPRTMARMAAHFVSLCEAIAAAPAAKIRDLQYLGEAEKQRLLVDFNATQADYPANQTLHQLFVEQVAGRETDTAVVCGDEQLTYEQLYLRSRDLALYLQSLGVGPDRLVGVCMERSLDMIVSMLGVLQAGGAYVPLDPNHPEERLAYMVRDSRAAIVLTQESLEEKLSAVIPAETQLIAVDRQRAAIEARVAELDAANVVLRQEVGPRNLSHVIYTSGSTGNPKGVAIEHHSPVTLVHWASEVYSREELANVLAATSICFDLSVYEIFVTLANGGTVVLVQNALGLVDLARPVTLINTVPSAIEELVRLNAIPDSVRTINLAGEPLPGRLVDKLYETTSVEKVFDLYGPSEDTTYSTYTLREQNGPQTIGRPLANTQVYIVDRNQQLQPVGVPGELCIAGDGLAREYLNRPDLTQEKFVANPFEPGTRMYKTGDLARWTDEGTLQYLGRIDTQVKIRGFRIEIGEIEARLGQHPAIQDCAVVAQGEGANRQLIAFYRAKETTSDEIVQLSNDDLRAHLLKSVPEYMVPAAFVSLAAIPLNPNGKVDRRALLRIDVTMTSGREHVAPRNETEAQLVAIWAEVLNLAPETIGVNDSFFELGGHSLLATQLVSKIRRQLDTDVPLKAVFERTTVAALAELVTGADRSEIPTIRPVDRSRFDRLPLSFAQERLWFINQLEPGSAGYNVPGAVVLQGELDVDQLERAFNLIIARHENLRTIFPSHEGQAHQRILDAVDFKLERIDLGQLADAGAREETARQLCQADAVTPFDLANGPLLRGKVIRLAEHEHVLMLNMHHIISDGWSLGVLIRELGVIVDAFRQGRQPQLAPLPIQYADYSIWQRNWLADSGVLERQLEYWEKKLAGVPESLDLTTDYPRPAVQSFAGATQAFALDAELTAQLTRLAERQGGTLYMVLLTAFKALLHRYTGQNDLCIGTPIANRQYGETEGLIGMFVNTLALRSQVEGGDTFDELFARVKSTCLEAYEHQDAPFEKVVDVARPQRNMAISPLFQVMVVLQNLDMGALHSSIQPYSLETGISKFDLTLAFSERRDGLAAAIQYSTALFKPETIARLAEHFTAVCRAIVATPSATIRELDYLNAAEEHRLLVDFNATDADYPAGQCLHQLFVEQVAAHSTSTAVVCGDDSLTYRQLYARSHDLALYLQSQGIGPDSLVGLCMERSADMLVSMLGILQAGGAYVPLDPNHPEDRLAYMVRDSRATIVLTQESLQEKLSSVVPAETRLIAFDRQRTEIAARVLELKTAGITLRQEVGPTDLAYVIYTSGSTGQPKGVAIEHHSPVTLVHWGREVYSEDELSGVLAATSICFDLSVYEIFLTLASGGTIILVPNALALATLPYRDAVTLINTVPSAMEELVRMGAIPDSVQTINLAGEPLSARLVDKIYETTAAGKVYDLYGPSEDTTYSTYVLRTKNGPQTIGRPIANTQVYILDAHGQVQPTGVPGELHIAGDGLARGYLHRPELTQEKFVANPFQPGTRMYRTGDLARWMDDGTLQYLGRIDTQVKIRGFRIELGEIEARLNEHVDVQDGVVIAQGQGADRQLVAFYRAKDTTADGIVQLPTEELRAHLLQTLPDYMVPVAFVSLTAIPLNPNGKVDRRALSRIDVTITGGQEYVAPRNETERRLVAIWAEVLNRTPETLGVNDNFFDVGGHSLTAVQLMAKTDAQFRQSLPLSILFSAPTIAALAKVIAGETAPEFDILVPIQMDGDALPVFAVPGAGGSVLSLRPLSLALGDKQPLYALQAVGLDGKAAPLDNVEQTALVNIDAMKALQPAGPYRLIGHSYGGVVAYEMARLLLEQGEEVSSLVLLDSLTPMALQRVPLEDDAAELYEACMAVTRQFDAGLDLDLDRMRRSSDDENVQYVTGLLHERGLEVSAEQFAVFHGVYRAHLRSHRTYTPSTLPRTIDVSLYRATQAWPDESVMPRDYGWSELLQGSIRIHDVEANHLSILEKVQFQNEALEPPALATSLA